MRRVLRGDVYWADPGPVVGHEQGGRRPVLVVSGETFNRSLGIVIAMMITTRAPRLKAPLSWALASGGLPRSFWVKTWQIRSLSVLRLGPRVGRVEVAEVDRIVEGLLEIVGP